MSSPKDNDPESLAETLTRFSKDLSPRELADQAVRALAEQASEAAAEKAAMKAVAYAFLLVGVNIQDKEQVARFRDDIGFLYRMNRGAREVKNAAIKTCVGALLTGTIAIFWLGFQDWFAKFFK